LVPAADAAGLAEVADRAVADREVPGRPALSRSLVPCAVRDGDEVPAPGSVESADATPWADAIAAPTPSATATAPIRHR